MLSRSATAGFTLVELVVGLAVFAILLALGAPAFATWVQNAKIRTAATGIQDGLQLARAEAVRRNAQVRFQLTSATDNNCVVAVDGGAWVISRDEPKNNCSPSDNPWINESFLFSDTSNNKTPGVLSVRPAGEGGGRVLIKANNAVAIFNGYGRLVPATSSLTIDVDGLDAKNGEADCDQPRSSTKSSHCLRVTVSSGGQIRMCNPTLPTGDPRRC